MRFRRQLPTIVLGLAVFGWVIFARLRLWQLKTSHHGQPQKLGETDRMMPPPSPTPLKVTSGHRRIAFATLDVTEASRHGVSRLWVWPGVLSLAKSLQNVSAGHKGIEVGIDVDFVVMTLDVDTTLVPGARSVYEANGLRLVAVPKFHIPRTETQGGAWWFPWYKLGAWSLDYDVVVYLDADMLALQTPHALFRALDTVPAGVTSFAASTFACGAIKGDPATAYSDWTSGVMVLRPDRKVFDAMEVAAAGPSRWGSAAVAAVSPAESDGKFRNDQCECTLLRYYACAYRYDSPSLCRMDLDDS